ncbi:sensor histidine kinase [Streptomyces sp. NPDC007983]|uniref:sensor histidine kinase n=1 Tax=Streptomyces sp. NPDC007983 TaxID=3364800 RepID=UPI0036EE569D
MSRRKGARAAYGRAVLVVALGAIAVQNGASVSEGGYLAPAPVATLLCGVALLVRPLPWQVAPLLATAATSWWGWPVLPLLLVALFDLAAHRRARVAVTCVAAALGGNLVTRPATSLWTPQQYGSVVFLLLVVVGGLWLGNRRRLVAALAAQVDHLRVESRLREEAARAAERSRIAAEMHDVLAHRLSLIALHTGVLATKGDTLPAPVAMRLGLLRTASTEALADLRDVLGALRDPDSAPVHAALAPVVRDVRELADEARAAGQRVELTADGPPERAPTTHRLAVYRIVQEALTNARKHADGAEVAVRVDYRPPATLVEVTNAPGTPGTGSAVDSGYGLVGLRERVTALGGHLDAGPAGVGTWRLAARIPHPTGTHPMGTEQNDTGQNETGQNGTEQNGTRT